jgi:SAM-dependent methyltransferase
MLHHVPTIELQDKLFAEIGRVLRPGAAVVASDSLGSDELAAAHEGDTYNPVDPAALPSRLTAAGFGDVQVKTNEFGWAAIAWVAEN